VTIVPGVSSLQAAAARLGVEYTVPGGTQTVICTRAAGRTPVPASESLERLAASQSTLVIFLSAGRADQVVNALLQGGYAPDTPAPASTAPPGRMRKFSGHASTSWPRMDEAGIANHALLVIGNCLAPGEAKSLLYDGSFSHGFRNAERASLS
jgi:precorrin-4/cobalt-precorrin-4 C11-methyltransferase